jgi:hypothetical protein
MIQAQVLLQMAAYLTCTQFNKHFTAVDYSRNCRLQP